jgi:hypothetical protein
MHQIASGTFTEKCAPELFAYCPTMDLIATVKEGGKVDVSRLNGQRVFGATFEREEEAEDAGHAAKDGGGQDSFVTALCWKRDGEPPFVLCLFLLTLGP